MEIIKTHHIWINSSMRVIGNSDDFVISLRQPLTLTNQSNFFRVSVGRSVIPHTIKQINDTNHTLNVSVIRGVTSWNGSIDLTNGNYNIITILNELKVKLNTAIFSSLGINLTFVFTYLKTQSGCQLRVSGSDGIATSITLKFADNVKLGRFFGYSNNAVFSYNNTNVSTDSFSNIAVNVNPINYILIRSNSLIQRESYESIVEKDTYSDILAKIPVNVSPGSFIFSDLNGSSVDLENKIIDQIALYLSDNLSYTLNLNGLDWSTHLIFEEIGTKADDNLLHMIEPKILPSVDHKLIDELKREIENAKEA